ncbi:hypothetical protein [Rhodopila sp.]|jgi:hypothetical protein|uniref:hypothetical protein n=1 Tax=Rhodopila sp. TaxID=2480087 RepID=UPI002D0EEBAC|nr:hypothetical protein [Rhodopila sp.]HVZ08161.1 hypothetical protein [Rhodopila sp.]
MRTEVGDWIVGPMMAIFGLIGLYVFGKANDGEMAVFGASLAAFAVVFVFGLIRRHYDNVDAARAAAKDDRHG